VQVRTISREVERDPSQGRALTPQRLHAELLGTSVSGARAYLHGALHDATQSQLHRTIRFGQSDRRWLDVLAMLLRRLGQSSWQKAEPGGSGFSRRRRGGLKFRWDSIPRRSGARTRAGTSTPKVGFRGMSRAASTSSSCRRTVRISRKSDLASRASESDAAGCTTPVHVSTLTCGASMFSQRHTRISSSKSDLGTRGNAVCWKRAGALGDQDEDIVHAPWRHGESREQGSRTGRCGWITSFLGNPELLLRRLSSPFDGRACTVVRCLGSPGTMSTSE
jgi:hypothetical protein